VIKGNARFQYSDYNAYLFRENYLGLSKESMLERIEKRYTGIAVDDIDITNKAELAKPVTSTYAFTHDNSIEIISNRMYVQPLMFLAQTENPFKQEVREFPVDFSFPQVDKYAISLTIPDGYMIESVPEPKIYKMGENVCVFKYNITSTLNQIQLVVQNETNVAIIAPQDYETLKAFYKEMITKQNEKVVLKKI